MTQPRRTVAGQIHFISRRCLQRRFLLRPSKRVNQIVRYALAVAAPRHGIRIHAVLVNLNHYHLCLTDVLGTLPAFERDFDQLVARALNAHYGRGEAFWCPGSYDNVEVHDPVTLLEQLVYLYVNAVKDGQVARPEEWPGFFTSPEEMGTAGIVVSKPETAFFGGRRPDDWEPIYPPARRAYRAWRKRHPLPQRGRRRRPRRERSDLPDVAEVEITVPHLFEEMPLEEVHRLVRDAVEARLDEIRAERRRERRGPFRGPHGVRQIDPFDGPGDTFPTFKTNPRIACRIASLRVRLLAGLKAWREAYRLALDAWRRGNHQSIFPPGTYGMRVVHRVRVSEAALVPT
jgi:hypothetical protein